MIGRLLRFARLDTTATVSTPAAGGMATGHLDRRPDASTPTKVDTAADTAAGRYGTWPEVVA